MNFVSDNAYGVWPEMLAALSTAASGTAASYGDDEITDRLEARMSALFERNVAVFPVITGTAANALALATLVPPHGAVLCHAESHIATDECGAPEFFSHGAKLIGLEGRDGRVSPESVGAALGRLPKGVHHVQPRALSITQSSELGTVYRPAEIARLSAVAREHGLKVHMDGARFANAVAFLGTSPADITWRAGVDVLSFGATKNGAFAAEAVVFFHPDDASDFDYRRKKSGHLISKLRFVSAQLDAYVAEGRWLQHARRANQLARLLAEGLAHVPGAELAHPVEANAVFVRLPDETVQRLRKADARFYDWAPSSGGRTLVRLVTAFATPEEDVTRLLAIARK